MWKNWLISLRIFKIFIAITLCGFSSATSSRKKDVSYEPGYLYGSYSSDFIHLHHNVPSVASYWKIYNAPFKVSIWPPKYCQAVFICLVKSQILPDKDIKVDSAWCSDGFKVYPHTSEIVHLENGGVAGTYFIDDHVVSFESDGGRVTDRLFKVEVNTKAVRTFSELASVKKKKIQITMKNRDIVLLTDSLQCRATVLQARAYAGFFYPIVQSKYVTLEKSPFAKLIAKEYYKHGQPETSLSVPPYKPGPGRSTDHLNHLKKMEKVQLSEKMKSCNRYKIRRGGGIKKKKTNYTATTLTYSLSRFLGHQGDTIAVRKFDVSMTQCHWLRLSIYKDDEKTKFEADPAKFSFDFFFDEGFYQTPDSDEAKPLAVKAQSISVIQFRFYETPAGKNGEFLYSRINEQLFSYREYFSMQLFKDNEVKVVLTKSETCDATLVASANKFRYYNEPNPGLMNNDVRLDTCEFGAYKAI